MSGRRAKQIRRAVYGNGHGPAREYYRLGAAIVANDERREYRRLKRGVRQETQ